MANVNSATNSAPMLLIVAVLLAAAFAGGYYYYQQKDKDTVLDINLGGKQISAQIEHN